MSFLNQAVVVTNAIVADSISMRTNEHLISFVLARRNAAFSYTILRTMSLIRTECLKWSVLTVVVVLSTHLSMYETVLSIYIRQSV